MLGRAAIHLTARGTQRVRVCVQAEHSRAWDVPWHTVPSATGAHGTEQRHVRIREGESGRPYASEPLQSVQCTLATSQSEGLQPPPLTSPLQLTITTSRRLYLRHTTPPPPPPAKRATHSLGLGQVLAGVPSLQPPPYSRMRLSKVAPLPTRSSPPHCCSASPRP